MRIKYLKPIDYDYDKTEYLEHELTAEDLYDFFTKHEGKKVDKETLRILVNYDYISEDKAEQDDDLQDFLHDEYEGEFLENQRW